MKLFLEYSFMGNMQRCQLLFFGAQDLSIFGKDKIRQSPYPNVKLYGLKRAIEIMLNFCLQKMTHIRNKGLCFQNM